jgi:hypothetical protein
MVQRVARNFDRRHCLRRLFAVLPVKSLSLVRITLPYVKSELVSPNSACRYGWIYNLCLKPALQGTWAFKDQNKWFESTFISKTPPIIERALLCLKVPRLRPFVLIIATCTWKWQCSIGTMILTGDNWSTGRETLYSVGGRCMNEYGALAEWYWQGKTEVLGEKHYTVIPRLTKIIRSGITFVSRNVISRRFL